MNKKGGMAFWVSWGITLVGFFMVWMIIDTADYFLRDTSEFLIDQLNETKNMNNTYFEDFLDTKTTIINNWDIFKQVYFWGGVTVLLLIPIVYSYRLRSQTTMVGRY